MLKYIHATEAQLKAIGIETKGVSALNLSNPVTLGKRFPDGWFVITQKSDDYDLLLAYDVPPYMLKDEPMQIK